MTTPSPSKTETATLAGGCFWCVESDLEPLSGVKEVISGYTGGQKPNPTYKEVSSGSTGHQEAVQVIFDPEQISYSKILDVFWRKINPLDEKGQFVDRGLQYTTGIFYHTEEQKRLALQSKRELETKGPFKGKKIVTPVKSFTVFYRAEDYHQDYYKKNSLRYKFYRYRSGRDQFLEKTWKDFKDFRSIPTQKTSQNHPPLSKIQPESVIASKKPSKEELKKRLTPLQYQVTQEEGTEKPFANEYWNNKREGIYVDVVSGEPLFSSLDKYNSGTGWPSFTKPLVPENIVTKVDLKFLYPRTEVRSKKWDSHLGHVFKDGPPPEGLRYCINSAALRFIAKEKLETQGYGQFTSLFNSSNEK